MVGDDPYHRDGVFARGLRDHGFDAVGLSSASELYKRMMSETFDIVVLDLSLPDKSGFDVVQHLRNLSSMGIVLTGRNSTSDRRRGLLSGADAYLTKPVELELLTATLQSLVRRMEVDPASPRPSTPAWQLEAEGWKLVAPNNNAVDLTHAERCILRRLIHEASEVVARDTLIGCLTDDEHAFDPHRLEMLVYRLRRKVRSETGLELPLRAVRGKGYVFAISVAGTDQVG